MHGHMRVPTSPGPALPGGPASRLCLGAPDPTTSPSPCGEGRGPRSPCWRGKASYSLVRGPDAQESGGRGEQERDRGMAGRACWQDYARRDARGRRVPTFPVWASKKQSKQRFGMALCSQVRLLRPGASPLSARPAQWPTFDAMQATSSGDAGLAERGASTGPGACWTLSPDLPVTHLPLESAWGRPVQRQPGSHTGPV